MLVELGVTGVLKHKKCLAAIEALDTRITRAPADFMEWRVANLRLFDLWIMPLVNAPRIGSLYARYFMSADTQAILGSPGRVLAEMGFARFWICTVFAPEVNLFAVLEGHDIKDDGVLADYADTIVRVSLVFKMLLVFFSGAWATSKLGGNAGLKMSMASMLLAEALGLFGSVIGYYVGWYIIPILMPFAWGQAIGQLYGWIHIHSVLDKDHDGNVSAEEVASFVMEAVMRSAFVSDGTDPVASLMSVPQTKGTKMGGGCAAIGLLGWLVAMVTGMDARQGVLDANFLIVPWVLMPVGLLTLFFAGRIGVAFLEFARDAAKMR